MKIIAKRLKPGEDLKKRIIEIASEEGISAGCVVNAAGSLAKATLRTGFKNGKPILKHYQKLEVVSLTGTIGKSGSHVHLHLSGADISGKVFGGHLVDGCIVFTTIELMILSFDDKVFTTEIDPKTGFEELLIKTIS
jgi:uncharacterized protein